MINQLLFLSIEEAAERVTLATAPSAALRTAPKSLSVKVFPPKKKASTTKRRIIVRGTASIGEVNHSKTSSMAAIPKAT